VTHGGGNDARRSEKAGWVKLFSNYVYPVIYLRASEVFEFMPGGEAMDVAAEVFPRLREERKPLFGAVAEGYWEDVGTLDAYIRAHHDVLDGKVDVDVPGFRLGEGVWVGERSEIDPDATIEGPIMI